MNLFCKTMLQCGKKWIWFPSIAVSIAVSIAGLFFTSVSVAAEVRTDAYLFFAPGTVWVFQDTQGAFHRRSVKPVREVSVAATSAGGAVHGLGFLPVVSQTGSKEEILEGPETRGSEDNSFTQYYLRTTRGLLRSSQLGEGARDFWPQAFLVLPAVLTPGVQWEGQVEGARLSFQFDGVRKISVPAGSYDDCLSISYQHGMEPSGRGEIDYCAGIGEVRVVEGDYRRELVRFRPGIGVLPASAFVDEALTTDLLRLLPQAETVAPVLPTEQSPMGIFDELGLKGRRRWLVTLTIPLAVGAWVFLKRRQRQSLPKPLELSPEVQEELRKLALLRDGPGLQAARTRLAEMVRSHPEYADLHFHLGEILQQEERLDEARHSLQKATEINPQYVEALLALAKLKHRMGDLQGAATSFDQVLMLRPSFADIHNTQGEILQSLGDAERARFHFTKALEINPHFERARKNLQSRPPKAS